MSAALSARTLRPALLMVLVFAVVAGRLHVAEASPSIIQDASPEQQLADKYVPVAYLKQQKKACDTNGEPYLPAPVEIAFGDPAVALKEGEDKTVIVIAPEATALTGGNEEQYLDLPGNPRNPKCDYETHARERMQGQSPTTYAHIVVDEDEGKLALQYRFYYYFNDFKKLLSEVDNGIAACQSMRK